MTYEISEQNGLTIIALAGEIDLHKSPEARKVILNCLHSQGDLLVDLSKVEYIDSSGVASLVEGFQVARKLQRKFGLVGVSEAAMKVLRLAHLDRVFPIYDSPDDYRDRGTEPEI